MTCLAWIEEFAPSRVKVWDMRSRFIISVMYLQFNECIVAEQQPARFVDVIVHVLNSTVGDEDAGLVQEPGH